MSLHYFNHSAEKVKATYTTCSTSPPPYLWASNCSIRNLITSAAAVTLESSSSTTQSEHNDNTTNLITSSSSSVSSFCPSLSDTNQSQSSSHQGTPPSLYFPVHTKKPIKSAMKRSSGGAHSNNKSNKVPLQCIPSGLAGGSIVMPSGGGMQQGSSSSSSSSNSNSQYYPQPNSNNNVNNPNGYISPQYGWYISMTPPTPQHYPDASSSKNGQQLLPPQSTFSGNADQTMHNNNHNNSKLSTMKTVTHQGPPPINRPVFTRSLKGVPNNISGWPSVPL
jgi:hypothetical protein